MTRPGHEAGRRGTEPGWPWLGAYEPVPDLAGHRPVIGERGMVSSPHALASAIGLDVLKRGGNAVDAAVATSAALMVTSPMQCGPGGDAFWVIARPGEAPIALDASGRASFNADPAALRAAGHDRLAPRSAHAVTVPGAVSGWAAALERYGSVGMADLLQPVATLAEDGLFVSRHIRASFLAAWPYLLATGAIRLWAPDGECPRLYGRLTQPMLAATLRAIAASNGQALYEGALAAAIAGAVRRTGGWLDQADLAAHRAEWVTPLVGSFRGLSLYTTPLPTQGCALLAALAFVQGECPGQLDVLDPTCVHLLVEATAAALAARDRAIDRREGWGDDLRAVWGPERVAAFHHTFDPEATTEHGFNRHDRITKGDTAHLAIVDRDGMAVSLIQSLFFDFGSCIPVPEGGFSLGNRGASFRLDIEGPGALRPGARPPSTLTPTIVTRGGQLHAVLGCMGGDGQIQTQLQLLVDLEDGGLDPQQAVSRPRWFLDRTDTSTVLAEAGVPAPVIAGLRERRHRVDLLGPSEDVMGHAQIIRLMPGGALVGAADPRSDGQAIAF